MLLIHSVIIRATLPDATILLLAHLQVTICYGQWPADPFFRLFGFVPADNGHESAVIFGNLRQLLQCCTDLVGSEMQHCGDGGDGGGSGNLAVLDIDIWVERTFRLASSAMAQSQPHESFAHAPDAADSWQDMTIGADGRIDPRITRAVAASGAALAALPGPGQSMGPPSSAAMVPVSVNALCRHRCAQLLAAFSTSVAEDDALLRAASVGPAMRLAVEFRRAKKSALMAALAALG